MLNNDQLNDAYELHQLKVGLLSRDEFDTFFTKNQVGRLSWYNAWLDHIGEGLINIGKSIRERNSADNSTQTSSTLWRLIYESFIE